MTVSRMDNVGIVVADLDAAIAFFVELGLELEGRTSVEGSWVDGILGMTGVRTEIAMLRVPGGLGRVELTCYAAPAAVTPQPHPALPNALGGHRMMFAVEDIHEVIRRLEAHGATLMGEVVDYAGVYRLCYLRGPEGIIVALAEAIG